MKAVSFRAHVMAVERVERRLRRVTAALDRAGVPYAVIGGNAVAAWVGRVAPAATRATRDVDLLVDRAEEERLNRVMAEAGFARDDLRRMVIFLDPDEPDRRSGVHVVWAGEKVRPSYLLSAPSVSEAVRDPEGFWVLDLKALVRMKLTSNRDIDRVHLADLVHVGLMDDAIRTSLPPELRARLNRIEAALEE